MSSPNLFQSTLPLRGATPPIRHQSRKKIHFNPHSPCGERRYGKAVEQTVWEFQSTLPLREATRYARYNPYRCDFNPHSPCGERRGWRCRPREGGCNFNPHSPCGERPDPHLRAFLVDVISIHTPLAGSDDPANPKAIRNWKFQSTLPLRGATMGGSEGQTGSPISIHTPLAGSDLRRTDVEQHRKISIHTPLAGSDSASTTCWTTNTYFNPHSPCGERPPPNTRQAECYEFQSTLPLRGATGSISSPPCLAVISIHTPLAGSDRPARGSRLPRWHFNPHSPCGERLGRRWALRP